VAQDAFPSKPVSIIVPYPAGGFYDVIARKFNVAIGKALAQPVIVKNYCVIARAINLQI
jgi:tripartite-type tricarboxylate transporter receptor subunit TctC